MTKRNRHKRRGTGLERGHGSNSKLPAIVERPLSRWERAAVKQGLLEPGTKGYFMGACTITVGSSHVGHHLSIAHPKRYPTWDEMAKARYELLPSDLTFGMAFPPSEDYVNVHNNCFHLWEITGLGEARKVEVRRC